MTRETYNGPSGIGTKAQRAVKEAVADEYFIGMPLKFSGTPVAEADEGNTGNGTVGTLSANKDVPVGAWTLEMTAALVAKLTDPDGNDRLTGIALTDDGDTVITFEGLQFTVSDGATAFVSGDKFTITVDGSGKYAYNTSEPEILSYEERELTSDGKLGIITQVSEFSGGSVVDDSGEALTLTAGAIQSLFENGIIIK